MVKYLARSGTSSVCLGFLGPATGGERNGTYDVQTIKEVTSATKIAQVCLEDIEAKTGVVTQKDFRVCDCVILELMDSISYREYWEVEQNILYGRDWKGTEAMRRTRPQLVEACDWPG